jgi:hypothetical protein
MTENNGVYVNMRIKRKDLINIRDAHRSRDREQIIGTLSILIEIDGDYTIPIRAEKKLDKRQFEKMIDRGTYDIYTESIGILFQIKPVCIKEEREATPDLDNF